MSFEEEFDRIIRQKANEAEYPFDEKSWEKARAMVDADRKSGSKRPVALFYSVALILLSLGVAAWLLIAGDDKVALPLAAGKVQTEAEKAAQPVAEVSAPAQTPAQAMHTVPQKSRVVLASAKSQGVKANAVMRSEPVSANEEEPSASRAAQRTPVAPEATQKTNEPAQAQNIPPAEQLPVAEKQAGADTEAALPAAEPASTDAVAQSEIIPQQAAIAAEAVSFEPLNPIYSRLPVQAAERELQPTINMYDEDYYKKKRFKTHFLNAEAGAAYLAGWDVKGGKDGKGLNWFAGFNYGLYVSKKIALGAGLQMYNISNIEKPFYSVSTTAYGFGSTGTRTVITTSSIYYAALPVKVYYLLNAHSQFGAGVNIGMPVEARSTVETYGLSDHVVVNSQKETRRGVYEGISATNVLVSAFYRTQVASRIHLNGELIYGVSDIFANLQQANREQALGLRLSLSYTLFDK